MGWTFLILPSSLTTQWRRINNNCAIQRTTRMVESEMGSITHDSLRATNLSREDWPIICQVLVGVKREKKA